MTAERVALRPVPTRFADKVRTRGQSGTRRLGGAHVTDVFANIGPRTGRYSFSITDWRVLTGPLVYAWVQRQRVLYIGMSSRGLRRALDPGHHKMQQDDRFRPHAGMRLFIWPRETVEAARDLERHLITMHSPRLNRAPAFKPQKPKPPIPGEQLLAAANRRLRVLEAERQAENTRGHAARGPRGR